MSNLKKTVLILTAVALACLIAAGVVAGVYISSIGGIGSLAEMLGREKYTIDETAALDIGDADALAVSCTSGDIRFVVSDEAKVTLTGYCIGGEPDAKYLTVERDGGKISAVVEDAGPFPNVMIDVKLTVYLPADNLLDLTISSTSGDLYMADMRFGEVVIDKTSGDADIENCAASGMRYQSSSGDTGITGCDIDSLSIVSISGDVRIAATPGDISVRSTSGTVNIDGADGVLDIESTSGGVTVSAANPDIQTMTVRVTSGNVLLKMPEGAAFDFEAQATSGSIRTDFDVTVSGQLGNDNAAGSVGGGGALVRVQTTSGNIRIETQQ